jgi:hypothetical protein
MIGAWAELSRAKWKLFFGGRPEEVQRLNPSRTNLRAVRWDWIDVEPDDQTLRIEFLHGIVDGLHHIEIDEDDRDIRVTVFLGLDPDLLGGWYAPVGLTGWTKGKTSRPVGRRHISDGAER